MNGIPCCDCGGTWRFSYRGEPVNEYHKTCQTCGQDLVTSRDEIREMTVGTLIRLTDSLAKIMGEGGEN